ncbi:hypothetical protein NLI96_g8297 [Meripilus lineatus]|uniref:Uncharacterized protein n=1 Tax=Meripilus lineatus TaxID=2056292 RepID=A0AAD5YE38_9APHY|nr:hypothetical protein NLI96_g8297 [Physisporinus lineatus]
MDDKTHDNNPGRDGLSPQTTSTSHPQNTYHRVITRRPVKKTCLLITLVVFHLGCNATIIWASLHTFRLGAAIIQDVLPVSDNRILSVINTVAKVLSITSAMIGGIAASHLWSRRLSKPGSSAGLAELQSLTIFQSVPTIYRSIQHLLAGRYISARWMYAAVIMSAILLQVYSIAISGLITPALTNTTQTRTQEIVYGSNIGPITNCVLTGPESTCLDIALSSKTLSDAMAANTYGLVQWLLSANNTSSWMGVGSTFNIPGLVVQALFPVGPINGKTLSDGGALWGVDLDSVLGVISIRDKSEPPEPRSTWDATYFIANFTSLQPSLQCLCGTDSNNVSHITIHNNQYTLASPILFSVDNEGEIAGRLTDDNSTLVLAFAPPSSSTNDTSVTYCAMQLRFYNMSMLIAGAPSNTLLVDDTMLVTYYEDASDLSRLIPGGTPPLPLIPFATRWLRGLGWDNRPVQSPIVQTLQQAPLGTDIDNGEDPSNKLFLEYLILVMVANGISSIFATLLIEDSQATASTTGGSSPNATIQFDLIKTQYFIGANTTFQAFFLFIIFLDSVFVLLCFLTILWDGWYPDLSNPVSLVQVALCSSPPGIPASSDAHSDPSTIAKLARSPISLQHPSKPKVGPLLWEGKYSLVNVESGEGGYLVLKTETPEGK